MTQVSKSNQTVKKILTSTVGKFGGRKIYVNEVDPLGWTYHYINDTGEPYVYVAKATGSGGFQVPRPGYGQSKVLPFPNDGRLGEVLLTHTRSGDSDRITMYVPRFDEALMDVARDTVLSGPGQKANLKQQLRAFGDYAGLAEAVLEAQAKMLTQATEGKKTSRQLDREIDEFLRGRRAP